MTVDIHSPLPDLSARPTLWTAMKRGLRARCPNCGRAPLMASYLKQVKSCGDCGEAYAHIRSDDAAPWLTVLVVGHLYLPVVLAVERDWVLPGWLSMSLWPVLGVALCLSVLPRAKTLMLSIIWQTRAPGSERDGEDAGEEA